MFKTSFFLYHGHSDMSLTHLCNYELRYELRRTNATEFPSVFVCLFVFYYHQIYIYYFPLMLSKALLYAERDEIQGLILVKQLT